MKEASEFTGLYLLSRHFLQPQLGHARRDRAPSKQLADSFEASLRRPAAWLLKATALAAGTKTASAEGFPETSVLQFAPLLSVANLSAEPRD